MRKREKTRAGGGGGGRGPIDNGLRIAFGGIGSYDRAGGSAILSRT